MRVKSLKTEVEGLRVNEDAFTVQVRDVSGTIHSFRKDELTQYEKVFAHSLMLEYSAALSDEDMDDLVSYMMSLRSEQRNGLFFYCWQASLLPDSRKSVSSGWSTRPTNHKTGSLTPVPIDRSDIRHCPRSTGTTLLI